MIIFTEEGKMSREVYHFLKYNQIPKDGVHLSESDEAVYQEFIRKFQTFKTSLEQEDNNSSAIFGSIMSMFGFNRHYCSISGRPIIGKYFKIGGKIVSKEAYEAYNTVLELEKIENPKVVTKPKTGTRTTGTKE